MRLLSLDKFDIIFQPLIGKICGIVDGYGNPGDRLIDAATRQLLEEFGIKYITINPFCDDITSSSIDIILLFGGGSIGGPRQCILARHATLEYNLPCVILPQSWHKSEELSMYHKVYIREKASLSFYPNGIFAPDLALGYDFPKMPSPRLNKGIFLRKSGHAKFNHLKAVDPATFCYLPQDYFNFLSDYKHVITDRLHLAISALGLGRKTTLLPVTYHKNRSMWETWLKDLGCEWADEPSYDI